MTTARDHERDVIQHFIARYNSMAGTTYIISRWPEATGKSGEIDAYAESSRLAALAIEHTEIETFDQQKKDDAVFTKYFAPLETHLRGLFDGVLTLTVPVFALKRGMDWPMIVSGLTQWLKENLPTLPETTQHQIDNVPFSVSKRNSQMKHVFLARRDPGLNDLTDKILKALHTKSPKLKGYSAAGATSVLLLESADIALTNHIDLYRSFIEAEPQVQHEIHQIWLAETFDNPTDGVSDRRFYCFFGPDEILRKANPENFMIGPQFREYWLRTIEEEQRLDSFRGEQK